MEQPESKPVDTLLSELSLHDRVQTVRQCIMDAIAVVEEYQNVWFQTQSREVIQPLMVCDLKLLGAIWTMDKCSIEHRGETETLQAVGQYLMDEQFTAQAFTNSLRDKPPQISVIKVAQDRSKLNAVFVKLLETVKGSIPDTL